MDQPESYDVVVVGGGPSGLSFAALVAARGWRVIVLEKHPTPYGQPRAGHIDHEVMRILQSLDAHEPILADETHHHTFDWYDAAGDVLMSLDWTQTSVSGFLSDFQIYMPVLEDALHASLARLPSATVRFGAQVTALEQDADGVQVTVLPRAGEPAGAPYTLTASYVIAADGAGSVVRDELLRIPRLDKGFSEQWLDIDVRKKRPLPDGIDGQWCDPARPIYIGPLGRRYHRFECALLPGETAEHALRPEMVWEVLGKYGVGPDDVEPIRQVVYTFEARLAERWREGRVFLMGDACHTMPPHMGQGMCSGIRDAANLAWKLDLVLRDAAEDRVLDSYEVERAPHVEAWIDMSLEGSLISQVFDPVLAAERDARLRAGEIPLMPFPTLTTGLLELEADGRPAPLTGTLLVQAPVETAAATGLLHDVFGHGFLLVSGGGDPTAHLDAEAAAALDALGAKVIWIGEPGERSFADPTGRLRAMFDEAGLTAVLARPDYYVAGGVADLADLSPLIHRFAASAGLRQPSERADEVTLALDDA